MAHPCPKAGTATLFEDHTSDQLEGLSDYIRYVHVTGPHYERPASNCPGHTSAYYIGSCTLCKQDN
jgi:hypothetical protein